MSVLILENAFMRVDFNKDSGQIVRLVNKAADETYLVNSLGFRIETDRGIFDITTCSLAQTKKTEVEISFVYKRDEFKVELLYILKRDDHYLNKQVRITGPKKLQLVVRRVVMESMVVSPEFNKVIRHCVIRECPFVMFLRGDRGSFFLGIEYPFFKMTYRKGRVQIAFNPNVIVKPGECFTSEREFLGVAKLAGRVIGHFLPKKTGWPGRIVSKLLNEPVLPSPKYVPLDWGEVRAVQDMTWKLLPPMLDGYQVALDGGWAILPNLYVSSAYGNALIKKSSLAYQPRSPKAVEEWRRAIDIITMIGIKVVGNLSGWYPYDLHLPTEASKGFDANEDAQKVLGYAHSKGVKLGFYTGGGDITGWVIGSTMNFLPERKEWKILDTSGQARDMNCVAYKPFADWYLDVQDATIKKFDLGFWSWDNMNTWLMRELEPLKCYSGEHGHLPGDCTYIQYKNAMQVLRRLKERNPKVWVQSYWGHKRYGPWFLRYIDTHENIYEFGPHIGQDFIFPTIHLTQQYGDALRFQCWWNQNLRFLPPWKNYSQFSCFTTARIAHVFESPETIDHWSVWNSRPAIRWKPLEEIEPPSRREYLDEMAWKYGLLSAIATGGALILDILLDPPEEYPEFFEFFNKWVGWARENNKYLQAMRSIFGPPEIGSVDGYAHVIGDRGFLFLFNPNARKKHVKIHFDESIDLKTREPSLIIELYPDKSRSLYGPEEGFFPYGSELELTVPSRQAMVLEIKPKDEKQKLFGVAGEVKTEANRVEVSSVRGEEGTEAKLWIKTDNPKEVTELLVNGQPIPFKVENGMLTATIRFAGEPITCELDDWETDKYGRVRVENRRAMNQVTFSKTFFVPGRIREILVKGRSPKSPVHFEKGPTPGPSPWADMNRFIVSIPLSGAWPLLAEAAGKVEGELNGKPVPVKAFGEYCYYLDLTDIIHYGENNTLKLRFERLRPRQFLGPYIENLPVQMTDRLTTPP